MDQIINAKYNFSKVKRIFADAMPKEPAFAGSTYAGQLAYLAA